MFVCACASEECAVLGCRRVREIQERHLQTTYRPNVLPGQGCAPIQPLTEERIRQMVREELARALAAEKQP